MNAGDFEKGHTDGSGVEVHVYCSIGAVLINAGEAGDVVPGEPSLLINACDVARLSWRR